MEQWTIKNCIGYNFISAKPEGAEGKIFGKTDNAASTKN
jgi:hypothetical protein